MIYFNKKVMAMKAKQIVVVGVGRFGTALLENLLKLDQQVLVIDTNADNIQMVNDRRLATSAVVADATNESVMKSLLSPSGSGKCEYDIAVVCIGENIESSILVSVLLKELGVSRVIAKVDNDLHGKVLEKILQTKKKGQDEVLYPFKDIAHLLAIRLVRPNIQEEIELSADYKFVRLSPPKRIVGKTLLQLDLRKKFDVNIIGIKPPNTEKVDFSVKPDTVIRAEDTLLAIIPNSIIDKFIQED